MSIIVSLRNNINAFLTTDVACHICDEKATNMYLCSYEPHVTYCCTVHIHTDNICECGSGARASGDVMEIIDKSGVPIKNPAEWRKKTLIERSEAILAKGVQDRCIFRLYHLRCYGVAPLGKRYCEEHNYLEGESDRCHFIEKDVSHGRCERKIISIYDVKVNSLYCSYHREKIQSFDLCRKTYKCHRLTGHLGACDQTDVPMNEVVSWKIGQLYVAEIPVIRALLEEHKDQWPAMKTVIDRIDKNLYRSRALLLDDIEEITDNGLMYETPIHLMSADRCLLELEERTFDYYKDLLLRFRPAVPAKHQAMIDNLLKRMENPKIDLAEVEEAITQIIEKD